MGRSLEKGVLPVLKQALLGCASAAVISEEQVKSTRTHYFFPLFENFKTCQTYSESLGYPEECTHFTTLLL